MRQLILLLFSQLLFSNASFSQSRVERYADKVWQDFMDAKREKDRLSAELKKVHAELKQTGEADREKIDKLNDRQDELLKQLKTKQQEYKARVENIRILKDTILALKTTNTKLLQRLDSIGIALTEFETYNKQLIEESKRLGNILYYKVKDLEIAEIENSYFSAFDIGWNTKKGPMFKKNVKGESVKSGLFEKPLEVLAAIGRVYTPRSVEKLDGRILIYVDDKYWAFVRTTISPTSWGNSYNTFDFNIAGDNFGKPIKAGKSVRIAFVTEECYNKNREKFKDFHAAYFAKPALFVISSLKPDVNRLKLDYALTENTEQENTAKDKPTFTDSCKSKMQEVVLHLCTNLDAYSGEFVSFAVGDQLIENNIMLVPFNSPKLFTYKLKLNEGSNLVKIKALTIGTSLVQKQSCNLFVIVLTTEGDRVFRKLIPLQRDESVGLNINYRPKGF